MSAVVQLLLLLVASILGAAMITKTRIRPAGKDQNRDLISITVFDFMVEDEMVQIEDNNDMEILGNISYVGNRDSGFYAPFPLVSITVVVFLINFAVW